MALDERTHLGLAAEAILVEDGGADVGAMGHRRIRRVIRFAETTVAETMIPIAEATTVDRTATTLQAIDHRRDESRRGAFRDGLDRKNLLPLRMVLK